MRKISQESREPIRCMTLHTTGHVEMNHHTHTRTKIPESEMSSTINLNTRGRAFYLILGREPLISCEYNRESL